MDSRARIDYALFHLTPTRTRCDLVIFANGQSEKLASGLLQPFLLHLKCAKEQIEKGGYSITLSPPAPAAWFTKGTLQRFVRFVSSPDVLERFVTIEKEIEQTEESIRSNELACEEADANGKEAAADATSTDDINDESQRTNHVANEEHSKIQLQRVLETRKKVLHKEQAMAYARALVTGFQTNHLDALVLFANTFGASRLREACYTFVKLCNKKNQDRLWIAEVAAMQASSQSQLSYSETSGIVLADDENSSGLHLAASDQVEDNGKPQPSSLWKNNYPQYFPNYYGPIHPHNMPPYQGYPFPGVHVGNPYYPGNMVTDTDNDRRSYAGKKKTSARKKGKSSREKVMDTEEDAATGSSSESSSEESVDDGKKQSLMRKTKRGNGKKSSKRVVIRNINYISSKKDVDNEQGSLDDEDLFDEDSIKQQIEEAVDSLHKHRRQKKQLESKHDGALNGSNGLNTGNPDTREIEGRKVIESWGAFQNILLRDQETNLNTNTVNSVHANEIFTANNSEGSILSRKKIVGSDSFIVNGNDRGNESRVHTANFNAGDNFRTCVKNPNDTDDMVMSSRGNVDQGNFIRTTQSDYAARSAIVNSKSGEDWYVIHKIDSSFPDHSSDQKVPEGEYNTFTNPSTWMDRARNDIVDDSFMVHTHDHLYGSELKTDLSMVLDVTEATPHQTDAAGNPQSKGESTGTFEPDDLYMVLDRSSSHEPFSASWTPEIDYENNVILSETNKNQSVEEPKFEDDEAAKVKGKGAYRPKALGGPLGKSKSEISSRNRKPAPKNKTTARKTKQELEEERRVRMEELLIQRQKRIAERKSNSVTSTTSNKETANIMIVNREKPPLKSVVKDKKPVAKSSTIVRLATAPISKQLPVAQSKAIQTCKASPKATAAPKNSVANGTKKPAPGKENESHLDEKISINYPDTALTPKSGTSEMVDTTEIRTLPEAEVVHSRAPVLAVKSQTQGKYPGDLGILVSDISDKKDSLVLSIKVTSFPVSAPAVNDPEEVKEIQISSDENKEKVPYHSEVDISTDVAAAKEKTPSESEHSHLKPSEQEQFSTEKGTDAVDKSPSDSTYMPDKDTDYVAMNTKQAKGPSVTFSSTTKVAEIPASTPPSSIGFSPEHIPSRKKWEYKDNSDSNSAKVAKGFKKLLMLGRKSRPISYA